MCLCVTVYLWVCLCDFAFVHLFVYLCVGITICSSARRLGVCLSVLLSISMYLWLSAGPSVRPSIYLAGCLSAISPSRSLSSLSLYPLSHVSLPLPLCPCPSLSCSPSLIPFLSLFANIFLSLDSAPRIPNYYFPILQNKFRVNNGLNSQHIAT